MPFHDSRKNRAQRGKCVTLGEVPGERELIRSEALGDGPGGIAEAGWSSEVLVMPRRGS